MSKARVKRGPGPKVLLTDGNYRKKALPHLLEEFERRCAFCLDPDDFRHPSLNHVDHFNCKVHGRRRHAYKNLMLSCAACNVTKHDKPIINPFDERQRLLNCTEENEFPEHIRERGDGQWEAATLQGEYHLTVIGLQEECHRLKRNERRRMADRLLGLLTQAIQYESHNPPELHHQIMDMVSGLLTMLDKFPPLLTDKGVQTVREWLNGQGVDVSLLETSATSIKA